MTEIELKYYATSYKGYDSLLDVWCHMLGSYRLIGSKAVLKEETYIDTANLDLRKMGIYARVDNKGELMLKYGSNENGFFIRKEVLVSPLDTFKGIDLSLARKQFHVTTYRDVLTLDIGDGIIEMCKDIFYYKGFGDETEHRELEFELKSGESLDIVKEVVSDFICDEFRPSEISKGERGYQLMEI